jgi:hypothetical protein
VIHAGVEQDALGSRGLARVNVGADADIAVPLDWGFACHDKNLKKLLTAGTRETPEISLAVPFGSGGELSRKFRFGVRLSG